MAARRELLEETGCSCSALEKIAGFYVAVGFATEFMHLYVGTVDLMGDATLRPGQFVDVRIDDASDYDLAGSLE
jgi:8-oxo-dGTP pyrophosphatase MutT (NUDIX family)